MRIEFDTAKGRVRIEMPDGMTSEDRAEIFDDLAGWEGAPKRAYNFGDRRLKKSTGELLDD